jgi:hypothetical protein
MDKESTKSVKIFVCPSSIISLGNDLVAKSFARISILKHKFVEVEFDEIVKFPFPMNSKKKMD